MMWALFFPSFLPLTDRLSALLQAFLESWILRGLFALLWVTTIVFTLTQYTHMCIGSCNTVYGFMHYSAQRVTSPPLRLTTTTPTKTTNSVGALLHFPPSSSPSSSPSLFGPDGESSGSTAAGAGAMDGGKGGYLGGFQWVVGQGLVVLGCAYCALVSRLLFCFCV